MHQRFYFFGSKQNSQIKFNSTINWTAARNSFVFHSKASSIFFYRFVQVVIMRIILNISYQHLLEFSLFLDKMILL